MTLMLVGFVTIEQMLCCSYSYSLVLYYAAPFSSLYTFSLHDETSFDSSLLLSSGEQHSEMLRTEICLQGTATYDVNILTVSGC